MCIVMCHISLWWAALFDNSCWMYAGEEVQVSIILYVWFLVVLLNILL